MTVKFYIDRDKRIKGDRSIYCFVYEKGEHYQFSTNEKINPEYWDKSNQRANLRKTKNTILKGKLDQLNKILNRYTTDVEKVRANLKAENSAVTFSEVKEAIKLHYNPPKKKGFFEHYDEFIQYKEDSNASYALIRKMKRVKDILQEYEKYSKKSITFNTINKSFLATKFFPYLTKHKNMIDNTAHKQIQFFKSFLLWAVGEKLTENKDWERFKSKSNANDVIYLTEKELMKLYGYKFESGRLTRAKDIFVFQCFTGVRYSDIQNLSRVDIKRSTWHLYTQKTGDIIKIPLNSYALSILAKYSDLDTPLPQLSNQKMNDYLKEFCKIAEIDEEVKIVKYRGGEREESIHKKYEVIGSHTARRTFITLSLQRGMKAEVIMKITGHTTHKMMNKYLKITDSHTRDEMDKVWGSSLRRVK